MKSRTVFPRLLVAAASLFVAGNALAQNPEADLRQTNTSINAKGATRLEMEPAPVVEESRPRTVMPIVALKEVSNAPALNLTRQIDQRLLAAIESHLGATYHFNTTGPETFDCSGLVWRAFQDIGVNFQRGPARSYWATFATPAEGENFKFGNLVFFSGLTHVGIVADEKGFYHSSRHHGVVYSPFNDYWLSRIDGFRRVPAEGTQLLAKDKNRPAGPANNSAADDEGTPRQ